MTTRRALVIFVFGFALVLGSCAPLGSAIYQEFSERPSASLDGGAAVKDEMVTLTPNRRARLVVDLEVETPSVQEEASDGKVEYHARYRFPLDIRIETGSGDVLLKQRTAIDWRDDTHDMTGRARQSSLIEKNATADASGGVVDVVAVYPGFDVPADGVVSVTAQLNDDQTYAAIARSTQFRVEHDLAVNLATLIISGIFMMIGGWIIAIVGFVMVLVTSSRPGDTETAAMSNELSVEQADEVRRLAMYCHLAGLLGYLIPFGNVIGPLVLWLMKREEHPYIDEQGKEALNFQLSMLAYVLLAFALVLVLVGFLLLPLLALFQIVMTVIAALKAKEGEAYRYPLTLRFIR